MRPLAAPERLAAVLSLAVVGTIIAFAILVSTSAGTAPNATGSPPSSAAASVVVLPATPAAATATETPPALRQLLEADTGVIDTATDLEASLVAKASGGQLANDLRRLNQASRIAGAVAQAAADASPAGKIAAAIALENRSLQARIAEGLAVSVGNTNSYRATARDVLLLVDRLRTSDESLRVLVGS